MKITLEVRAGGPDQRGGDIRLSTEHRWWRLGLYGDPPPRMSHIGLWRTRFGTMRGLNVRVKLGRLYWTGAAHRGRHMINGAA